MLCIEPDRLGIERIFLCEIHDGICAVHVLKRESGSELVESEELAVVLGRPAQQAKKVDESLGEEAGIAIGGDADHWPVPPLGKFEK